MSSAFQLTDQDICFSSRHFACIPDTGRRKKWGTRRAKLFLLREHHKICTQSFHYPIGQDLILYPHLAAKETGKRSLYLGGKHLLKNINYYSKSEQILEVDLKYISLRLCLSSTSNSPEYFNHYQGMLF